MLDPILCFLPWSLCGVLFLLHKVSNYYCHPRIRDLRKGIQGFVNNYSGLLACRFFLGLSEGLDIFRHHSLYSSACQGESFHALYSISLISILGGGYKYGPHEINVAAYHLTFLIGSQLSLCQHHYRALFPACWPLPLTTWMAWVVSPGGPGYSFWYVMYQLHRETMLIGYAGRHTQLCLWSDLIFFPSSLP